MSKHNSSDYETETRREWLGKAGALVLGQVILGVGGCTLTTQYRNGVIPKRSIEEIAREAVKPTVIPPGLKSDSLSYEETNEIANKYGGLPNWKGNIYFEEKVGEKNEVKVLRLNLTGPLNAQADELKTLEGIVEKQIKQEEGKEKQIKRLLLGGLTIDSYDKNVQVEIRESRGISGSLIEKQAYEVQITFNQKDLKVEKTERDYLAIVRFFEDAALGAVVARVYGAVAFAAGNVVESSLGNPADSCEGLLIDRLDSIGGPKGKEARVYSLLREAYRRDAKNIVLRESGAVYVGRINGYEVKEGEINGDKVSLRTDKGGANHIANLVIRAIKIGAIGKIIIEGEKSKNDNAPASGVTGGESGGAGGK